MVGRVRLNFHLQVAIHRAMVDIATRDDRSVADVIRESCRDYIAKDKKRGTSQLVTELIKETANERCDDGKGDDDSGTGSVYYRE